MPSPPTSQQLFFVLGREPAISIAEIFAVLKREGDDGTAVAMAKTALISHDILRIEMPSSMDPKTLMELLGGTIKIGRVVITLPRATDPDVIVKNMVMSLKDAPALRVGTRGRFGISLYDASVDGSERKVIETFHRKTRVMGMQVKRGLEETGLSVRWVTSPEPILSSVIVETNRLLREGVEVVLMFDRDAIVVGHTLAVQPFKSLEARDFTRPGRDARVGMLPPKLARMMVNLTAASREATLLDPFCGSGTVLAEALLLGYPRLIGTDIDPEGIRNTNRNLDWLVRQGMVPETSAAKNIKTFDCDIRDLAKHIESHSIGAIATETYLGPPLTGRESPQTLEKIQTDLAPLFRDTLGAFAKLLAKDDRAVIAFPLIRSGNRFLETPVLDHVQDFGLALADPLPFPAPKTLATEFGRNGKTLIYGRPDQRVWREIALLKHKT